MNLTPAIRKLIARKVSVDAIPKGQGTAAAINFLLTPGALNKSWKEAEEWCMSAIQLIRMAPEPNPWKNATDEEIAEEIIRKSS